MIDDKEIENQFFKHVRSGNISASITDYRAGFKAALAMIEARWPSEEEVWNGGANFYPDHIERAAFCNGAKYLRTKLFGQASDGGGEI